MKEREGARGRDTLTERGTETNRQRKKGKRERQTDAHIQACTHANVYNTKRQAGSLM